MGHIMDILDDAERMLRKGISEISEKGELNPGSLDLLGAALDAYLDIEKIKEKEMGGGYARGRSRDSMGRYMDDGYGRVYMDDGYRPYHTAYRDDRREEREMLERKLRDAQNDQERERYRRMIDNLS